MSPAPSNTSQPARAIDTARISRRLPPTCPTSIRDLMPLTFVDVVDLEHVPDAGTDAGVVKSFEGRSVDTTRLAVTASEEVNHDEVRDATNLPTVATAVIFSIAAGPCRPTTNVHRGSVKEQSTFQRRPRSEGSVRPPGGKAPDLRSKTDKRARSPVDRRWGLPGRAPSSRCLTIFTLRCGLGGMQD